MNKKIFSLLMMLALAFTSFVPAYAAPGISPDHAPPPNAPVKLRFTYNAKTRKVIFKTRFANQALKIGYGVVSMYNERGSWRSTVKHHQKNEITNVYKVPAGVHGTYCVMVVLYGIPKKHTGGKPTPQRGVADKCVRIP